MNPSYAYTNGSPKGLPGAPPSPPPPSTAVLGKKSTPPRLRRRGFTIGADDDDESSGGENASFGFGGGYGSAGAVNGSGGGGGAGRTGSPAGRRGKSKDTNKPAEDTASGTTASTLPTAQRKQRRRGRSLRKAALLRPGRGAADGVPAVPGVLGVPGATLSVPAGAAVPLVNGIANGSTGIGGWRTSSPGSLKLPSPVLSSPTTVITASAIYDSDEEGSAYRGGGGVSRYGRGRSGSVVVVMSRTRQEEIESASDTAYWGWVLGGITWVVFVVGMGSVLGVWEWAWDVPDVRFSPSFYLLRSFLRQGRIVK